MIWPAVLVVALAVAGCATEGGTDPAGSQARPTRQPGTITPEARPPAVRDEDSGARYRVEAGERLAVRLSNDWIWIGPERTGAAVEVVPVQARQDTGFTEWELRAREPGEVTLTWRGDPNCAEPAACPARTVTVALDVVEPESGNPSR